MGMEFDESKFYLGRLCRHSHRWKDTVYSLRYISTQDCIVCKKKANKEFFKKWWEKLKQENPEKAKAHSIAWQKRNPEKAKYQQQLWRKQNPDKIRAYSRNYYRRNLEEYKQYQRKYYLKHKGKSMNDTNKENKLDSENEN